ncbi:CHAP domain-containing protein [Hutsoniella sourekii]|uniref:CHAP domain-containing protein n=1 Tax=Hutsoniella sourekii TaxID=87650 RepID=UPI0006878CE9|nr:CHAP domain-containing protein [Hutsoniella sourekii]
MLTYNGSTLDDTTLSMLVKEAERLSVPPSYLIVKLHFEGLWGSSEVAKLNNNLSGMSMPNDAPDIFTRPSGVVVKRGSNRPTNEGGQYMKYANLQDFFTDWLYLIRRGGSYKIADSATFAEAVKGMFRYGGAKYDYATMNLPDSQSKQRYEAYLKGMLSRRTAINHANNGALDKLDNKEGVGSMTTAQDVIRIARKYNGVRKYSNQYKGLMSRYNNYPKKRFANRPVPNHSAGYDWCAMFVSAVMIEAGIGNKVPLEISVGYMKEGAQRLGQWVGRNNPKTGDIIIFDDEKGNDWPDHVGLVTAVSGNTVYTIEGNIGGYDAQSRVAERSFGKSDYYIQGYIRPPYGQAKVADLSKVPTDTLAQRVMAGDFGTGEQRKASLGARYEEVQKRVNELLTQGKKPQEEAVQGIIDGKYGNGQERVNKLKSEGYTEVEIAEIQEAVNKKLAEDKQETLVPAVSQKEEEKQQLADNEFLDKDGVVWVWEKK